MEESDNNSKPVPCIAGCGFYGNAMYNSMCSKCFKEKQNDDEKNTSSTLVNAAVDPTHSSPCTTIHDIPASEALESSSMDDRTCRRKHSRSRSPSESVPVIESPLQPLSNPASSDLSEIKPPTKPVQGNKGRCFKCRVKIPLAKQATNKCRCEYIFCDAHRYPDRHDCDINFAKLDRDIIAKNNPKLNERPKGGRSFQRIDSL